MDGEQAGLSAHVSIFQLEWKLNTMGLDTYEFVLWAEKEFQIEISDRDAESILTVGEFSNLVYRKLLIRQAFKNPNEHEIFERIKKHLISEFRIAPEKINYESRFVKDLGLDQ